uniref:G-protein coupled receptors family 2 profile 2 domain-containing protein n=1 Tax=Amphimedon queenslandica TaxID=400682 RepID=A0A1X7SW16_AMPQE
MALAEVQEDNGTDCNRSLEEFKPLVLVTSTIHSVTFILCIVAIVSLVFCRLFTLPTHRLILYLLVAILFNSFTIAVQFPNVELKIFEGEHATVCSIEGFLFGYSYWVLLLSLSMMTVHLSVMVLFPSYYNRVIKKLEAFYVLFPWLCPLLFAWIPFINDNFGFNLPLCWIKLYDDTDCSLNEEGLIMMLSIWYIEWFVVLIASDIALVIIFITMCKRAYKGTLSKDYRKALKQTLLLLVYPIEFQIFFWIVIANRLYQVLHKGNGLTWLLYVHAVIAGSGGLIASTFTLLYIFLLKKKNIQCFECCKMRVIKHETTADLLIDPADRITLYGTTVTSPTRTDLPNETEIEREYEL